MPKNMWKKNHGIAAPREAVTWTGQNQVQAERHAGAQDLRLKMWSFGVWFCYVLYMLYTVCIYIYMCVCIIMCFC